MRKKLACFAFVALSLIAIAGFGGMRNADAANQYILVAKGSGQLYSGEQFSVSAYYGPRYGNTNGTIAVTDGRYLVLQARVTCINVYGNQAIVEGYVTQSQRGLKNTYVTFYLEDNGTPNNGGDSAAYQTNTAGCGGQGFSTQNIRYGEVLVNQP